jgi:hypothetical protein
MIQNALFTVFTICGTNCCPCVLIVSRKGDVCADEGPNVKEEKESVVSVRESGGVVCKLDKGMSITVVRCHYDGKKLTACVIKKK